MTIQEELEAMGFERANGPPDLGRRYRRGDLEILIDDDRLWSPYGPLGPYGLDKGLRFALTRLAVGMRAESREHLRRADMLESKAWRLLASLRDDDATTS